LAIWANEYGKHRANFDLPFAARPFFDVLPSPSSNGQIGVLTGMFNMGILGHNNLAVCWASKKCFAI
jgi:hypothetical protein